MTTTVPLFELYGDGRLKIEIYSSAAKEGRSTLTVLMVPYPKRD
jgi:hypothetical protein